MAQYIDKSAVVAEIANLQATTMDRDGNFYTAKAQAEYNVLCMLESFIDTLEVKEVEEPSKDLEKEFDKCCENYIFDDECEVYTARKFFELGFKAKEVTQYTKQGAIMKVWSCISEASRELRISVSSISNCIKGLSKTAGGFIWKS